jgi:glycosyltransferase involved in cell wall biosynthesis
LNKITLAITTYNRTDLLFESFKQVADDPRLYEILIVDDCSDEQTVQTLIKELAKYENVRLIINAHNRGMAQNKAYAVSQSLTDWCILFDSDNIMDKRYLDALEACWEKEPPQDNVIYMPSKAEPNFDFTKHEGKMLCRGYWKNNISDPMLNVGGNTANYVVNKDFYGKCFKENKDVKGSDTVFHLLQHLKHGGCAYIVPGMHYYHRDHAGSTYRAHLDYNMAHSEKLRKEIQKL